MTEEKAVAIDLSKLENVIPNSNGTWQAACPKCREEGGDKSGVHLRVYPNKAFHCVKYSGDKEHNKGILHLAGNLTENESAYKPIAEPKIQIEETFPDSILTKLVKNYEYWNNRGLKSTTLNQFEGGIALAGKMKDRYVFPLRDEQNRIHGFTGRYIKPIPQKYDIPRWKHIGNKKKWMFDRVNTCFDIQKTKVAILVEGIGCVLALREVGIRGVMPIFGVVPSSHILSYLIRFSPRRIVISLNNEPNNTKAAKNGNQSSEDTLKVLSNFFSPEKLLISLPSKKDWMDSPLEDREAFRKNIYAGIG